MTEALHIADDGHIPAEAVIVGVGITPNSQLAEAAGLEVSNGVVTDGTSTRRSRPSCAAAERSIRAGSPTPGCPSKSFSPTDPPGQAGGSLQQAD